MTLDSLVAEALKEWKQADRKTVSVDIDGEVLVGDKLFEVYGWINHKSILITLKPKEEKE